MLNNILIQNIGDIAGFGILAIFAWFLVRSVVRQNERLTKFLQNHLVEDVAIQTEIRDILRDLLREVRNHKIA